MELKAEGVEGGIQWSLRDGDIPTGKVGALIFRVTLIPKREGGDSFSWAEGG